MKRRRSVRALLSERVRSLSRTVAETGRGPYAQDVDRLKPLAELVKLENERMAADWNRIWERPVIILVSLLTAGVVFALLTFGPNETEIELESRSTSVAFTVEEPLPLLEGLALSRLVVARVKCVSRRIAVIDDCHPLPNVGQITFQTEDVKGRRSLLNISSLYVPAHSRVTIAKPPDVSSYTIMIEPPVRITQPKIVVAARETTIRGVPGPEEYTPDRRSMVFTKILLASPIKLDVVPRANARLILPTPFSVHDIELTERRERFEQDQHSVRTVSSILSGFIMLNALDAKRVDLPRYDGLRFTSSPGEIRDLAEERTAEGTILVLRYHGRVKGMSHGSLSQPTWLMPSTLEVIMANRQASFAERAIVVLTVTALTCLTVLGIRRRPA